MKKILFISILFFNSTVFLQAQMQSSLKFVAWNIEHLAENNGEGCVARNEADYAKLRAFAKTMDADVVALQEVESAKAVARVFPESEWTIVISDRADSESYECRGSGRPSTQQKVAFAIRKGVEFEELGDFDELALGREGLRHGQVIKLMGTPEPIEVMNVHLKSGCFVNDYSSSDREACEVFEQQVPILDNWVETKIKEETAFVILGDFNHRISIPDNRFWEVLEEMDGAKIHLTSSMQNIRGCHPRYPDPIDHILVGPLSRNYYISGSEQVYYFGMSPETMMEEDMLSDHCPIAVDLHIGPSFPVSSAVRWNQNSAEYHLITSFLYQEASKSIGRFSSLNEPWVVIMDVDETLLNNSEYNRRRDILGLGFTSESWASWVREESATEIPGSKQFVSEVLEAGGQIALVTNRDRTLDQYTWNNLLELGFPINRNTTCIIGRAPSDIDAVGEEGIVNDKDLRRQQITQGNAESCWSNYPDAKSSWNRDLSLVMQVGDNIKDFSKTTQENVNLTEFLKRQGIDILVLPNAMYGSWE
ncbi:MAG: endonuclease/exonuclease/phosphatase family protein [Balneolales bacterium]|nr:endonuclease/exonuclease/phosphatase family protein [Balneolales bacterium]